MTKLAIGLVVKGEKEKVTVEFQGAELVRLKQYKEIYQQASGEEIDIGVLVAALAMHTIDKDKAFHQALKKKDTQSAP
ncbi:hypothetical protein M2404_003877 [Rheinheimera pacifica]|uniref:DUF2274 domain-containing protein n=1 Tax=Rheinheimera pacifica TaxID=173990 RepID=UPI00216AA55A|nr:DUF2274 domain-containing protein [Rheinheimera pacifica]MCS4309505.1 hypothetical protein [Rheinheimera pacifica]